MNLNIRPCRVEDAPRLFAIQEASFEKLEGFRMRHWSQTDFVEVLNQAHGYALVDSSQTIQAYVLIHVLPEAWDILHVATHPDVWGQGLMTHLIQKICEMRPEDKPIWLEVHEKNVRAIELYERLKFRQDGRRPKFYGDGGAALLYSYP